MIASTLTKIDSSHKQAGWSFVIDRSSAFILSCHLTLHSGIQGCSTQSGDSMVPVELFGKKNVSKYKYIQKRLCYKVLELL